MRRLKLKIEKTYYKFLVIRMKARLTPELRNDQKLIRLEKVYLRQRAYHLFRS